MIGRFIAALCFIIVGIPVALAQDIAGPARVVDGDTLVITGERVRLWGIDAPERDTAAGQRATDWLTGALTDTVVVCRLPPSGQDRDRYGRAVRRCFVGQDDVAALLVAAGHAADWPRYSDGFYAQ